jgi:hypothetical protein
MKVHFFRIKCMGKVQNLMFISYFFPGVMTWKNGHKYEGQFVQGKIQGKGIKHYGKGAYYAGNFQDGKMEGQGSFFPLFS